MKKTRNIIIFFILISLVSCTTTKLKKVECEEPPPVLCLPEIWSGIPIDTSRLQSKDYFYEIRQVEGLNTEINEWSLDFYSSNSAYLTYNEDTYQASKKVRQIEEFSFRTGSNILNKNNKDYGNILQKQDNKIIYSGTNNIPHKTEEYKYSKLVSLDSMIGVSRLYEAELSGENIINSKKIFSDFPHNTLFWVSQPDISNNGEFLVFSSDDSLSIGGTDLWYSKLENGEWTQPKNLGVKVNTTCDEVTPFFSNDDNYLYFSSNGHDNVGGYDLFKVEIEIQNGTLITKEPINLGSPINTEKNEIYPKTPVISDSLLYYSSNQEDGLDYNIYVFRKVVSKEFQDTDFTRNDEELTAENTAEIQIDDPNYQEQKVEEEKPETILNPDFTLFGYVYRSNETPIGNATITAKSSDTTITTKTNKTGFYELFLKKGILYEITAEYSLTFPVTVNEEKELTSKTHKKRRDFYLSEITQVRINFPTDEFNNPYKNIIDDEGYQTSITWNTELDRIAETIRESLDNIEEIQLVGHTDDVASDEYNKTLGKRRVEFVVNQLIDRGVPNYIMNYRSAGENEPLTKRQSESIEIFRKRLRRVTITMVIK